MQLGEELFGGRGDANGTDDGMGDDHYYQQWQCDDGGSPDGGPPPSVSLDGDASPPSGEQEQGTVELASERHPHREAEDGDDDVLGATRKRRDRSKTIVSERKRRVRMKEKLYELRALVPNITKVRLRPIGLEELVYLDLCSLGSSIDIAGLHAFGSWSPRAPCRWTRRPSSPTRWCT